jgi:hypothetical protein
MNLKLRFLASSQCGERRSGAWSSSRLGCWIQGPSSTGIALGSRNNKASGNVCPWLWCVVVGCCC